MATNSSIAAMLSFQDVQSHNTAEDCWVAIHSKVWDVTYFLNQHPGGAAVILQVAGKDATEAFESVHTPEILEETLPPTSLRGSLSTPFPKPEAKVITPWPRSAVETQNPQSLQLGFKDQVPLGPPPLQSLISLHEFEAVAEKALTPKAWAFFSSAATDLVTHRANKALLRRIMIRPRILRDVSKVDFQRRILGQQSSAPFFISPAAMGKLAHRDGELCLARGASEEGILQCISSNASYPLESITKTAPSGYPFFLQLYVNTDRRKTVELLGKAAALKTVKGIFVTVDAPVPGKREADERIAAETVVTSAVSGAASSNDKKGGGFGRLMGAYIDKSLHWEDLKWIREASGGLPIILKGVQTAEDAVRAVEHGCSGVMLSNHGGRSLDTAQPAILVLLELQQNCPEVFQDLDIFVDGGFERGSDILKAIALGATAVGIGRPYMYSLIYGTEGVVHLTQILKDELEVSMRLCGLTSLDQATPALLNTLDVEHLIYGRASRSLGSIVSSKL